MGYNPPKKATAYTFHIGLEDQGNPGLLKANPTIAAGDFKVSIDGGAFANLSTLPTVTPAGGVSVEIQLSSGEMNGDNIVVACIDASGAEWYDFFIDIQPATYQLDDISALVWAYGTRTLTSFGTLVADIWANGTRTLTSFGTLAADVWSSVTRTLTAFGEAGVQERDYIVYKDDGVTPLQGADIRITTDLAGSNTKWRGTSDQFGYARDALNGKPRLAAGTWYFWVDDDIYPTPDYPDTEVFV